MRLLILGVTLALCSSLCASEKNYRSDDEITNQMIKYARKIQTKEDEIEFKKIIKILSFPNYIYRNSLEDYGHGRATLTCVTCRSIVNTIINLYEDGASEQALVDTIVDFCTVLQIQPRHVCQGIISMNSGILVHILSNTPEFSSRPFCGIVLQTSDPNTCPFEDERYEWTVDVPEKKNKVEQPPKSKDAGSYKVAHISDAHYDPAYEAYSLAACNEATCCRRNQTEKASRRWKALYQEEFTDENLYVDKSGSIYVDLDYAEEITAKNAFHLARQAKEIPEEDQAGYWGDYRNCDTPWWAFVDGVDFVAENHPDLEYVYYTGDTIDHGVWETSYEMITDSLNDTYDKFKEAFGDKPVFPGIGNHESQPLNQFAPSYITDPELSTQWLYEVLYNKWLAWIPADTKASILEGGYYTVLVKPGFRIIVLNSNLCYVYNWWIHLEPKDPSGQLAWLANTLLEAENAGEIVHILSHIPTGISDVYTVCSREYARIVERFSDIITAEFNGHTHNDEFKIYYNKETGEPFNVAWNGGSMTSYSYVNLNYRVYEVDAETHEILDVDTWVYNLTEANLTPGQRPRWYKEYSFKEHFGIDSVSPAAMDGLVKKMVSTDRDLLVVDYHRFRGKSSERFVNGVCSDDCVKSNLCYMVKTELYESERCDELFDTYKSESSKSL